MAKKLLFVFVVLSLFNACGELDTLLLSSNRIYQVRAIVNGSSLEDCSLVWAGDQLNPYFANFIANDPDLIGLVVFLEDSQGEVAGGKINYVLDDYADELGLAEYEAGEEREENEEIIFTEEATEAEEEAEIDDDPSANLAPTEYMTLAPEPAKKTEDALIIVKRLDMIMPDFPIPADLEIGQYTLVFEALGREDILHRAETVIFYLGNAEFSLRDIQMYFPGVSTSSQLIPPETILMLEAQPEFDKRLDPYIVWYYGKDRIEEGKLSDGAGAILWKAPKQTGFHSVRAEILPFQPQKKITGIFREISIPVSSKAAKTSYFFNNIPAAKIPQELILQYQFGGNLDDSRNPTSSEHTLKPTSKKAPRWTPLDYSYGLATGPEDEYILPSLNFLHKEEETGGGQLLLHFSPASDGNIFSAVFPLQTTSGENAEIYLFQQENTLVLRLNAPGELIVETPILIIPSETDPYTTAVVDFFIRLERLEARLSLKKPIMEQCEAISIRLIEPLTGESRIKLGGPLKLESIDMSTPEQVFWPLAQFVNYPAMQSAEVEKTTKITSVVWDELAVLYSAEPLVIDEPEEEEVALAEEEETADDKPVIQAKPKPVSEPEKTAPATTVNNQQEIAESTTATSSPTILVSDETDLSGKQDLLPSATENT